MQESRLVAALTALTEAEVQFILGDGIHIRVLDLETLICLKERLAEEKDLAMLPVLRQTLSETKKKQS